jgi:hypothetical protein
MVVSKPIGLMDLLTQIRDEIDSDWIPYIYEENIRPRRTRSFEMDIPERENSPVVLHTLLGVELKIGRMRLSCPDLGTARYLAVFAAFGCQKVAVPYDITAIPPLADQLENAWTVTFKKLEDLTRAESPQTAGRTRARLVKAIRDEIAEIGAGERMPLFNTSTRQRET